MNTKISYNNRCLLKDGLPWFPVMGEMHYSRYKESLWEESLCKIKAGGLEMVSSYLIWIHHEEEEGIFRFDGCRNLRHFLALCKKVGLFVFLRLGPFVHGEVRNGGLPDWLVERGKESMVLRSNDEAYLAFVRRYWVQLFEQVRGFLYEDGGPVIGIQIENEYGHVGGLRGSEGEAHMRTLTAMAEDIGFHVPLFTATGWGGACVGDLLPVMGGYCEAPWDQRVTELEPNSNYVFSHERSDALIGSDHHISGEITYDESKFPFLTAELGGGVQVSGHRRPVPVGKDIGAMSLVKLGSGVAMLGYYMYHGGSNPEGKLSTLQESRATGFSNDLPEINYDFRAPIRQYGTISDSYREIRLLAYFLQDFGTDIAALEAEIQPDHVKPGDFETLRLSCRHDGEHGFVFFNNYQRRWKMASHPHVELCGICDKGNVTFPEITIEDGDYGFFPYRMKLGEATLHCALATPLCLLHTKEGDTYVFYGDYDPQFSWEGEKRADILLLSRQDALSAGRVRLDQDYLILADDFVWKREGDIIVVGGSDTVIKSFPELPEGVLEDFTACGKEGRFTVYRRQIEKEADQVEFSLLSADEKTAVYEITVSYGKKESQKERRDIRTDRRHHDTLLHFGYAGEHMEIFAGEKKINDYFYTGETQLLSLGYFDFPQKLRAVVYTLHEEDPIFLEKRPAFREGRACSLGEVSVQELFW